MKKLIATLGICASLTVGSLPGSSQENCFPRNHLTSPFRVITRQTPHFDSNTISTLTPNQTYTVLESNTYQGTCWARLHIGWVIPASLGYSLRSYSQETPTTKTEPEPTATETTETETVVSCYPHSKAYITGSMNIRSGPSTSNSKVGSAKSGESLSVSRSQQGDKYCWLKIAKGWIAKTARVRATKPPAYSPSSTNTAALPPIKGNASFQAQIVRAFNYLRDRAPNWFNYVTGKFSSVEPYWGQGAGVYANSGRLVVSPNARYKTMELASVLVHEACHVYQWDAGRHRSLGHEAREYECTQKQIDMVNEVEPGATAWLKILRKYQQNPY